MPKHIPVIDSCTLSDHQEGEVLIDHFADYLRKHERLIFPHRHNFYHLVFFTAGSGSHAIDFSNFEVKAGQIYFMSPGQVHSWSFNDGVEGYVINFSKEFFQSFLLRPDFLNSLPFFSGIASDGVLHLNENTAQEVSLLCEKLLLQVNNGKRIKWDMVRVLLLYLFMLIESQSDLQEKEKIPVYNYTILRNFQQLIEQHYASMRLPKDYADLLYVTPNHLNALCKAYLGMQAGEVIRNRILLEAKRLLVSQDMSISEISYQLSFNDNSYFTKFFKKLSGFTPEEFRRRSL